MGHSQQNIARAPILIHNASICVVIIVLGASLAGMTSMVGRTSTRLADALAYFDRFVLNYIFYAVLVIIAIAGAGGWSLRFEQWLEKKSVGVGVD